jgi:hypothetical protein
VITNIFIEKNYKMWHTHLVLGNDQPFLRKYCVNHGIARKSPHYTTKKRCSLHGLSDATMRNSVLCVVSAEKLKLSSIIRLLVREGAPHQQTWNYLKNNQRENGKNLSRVPDGRLIPGRTGRLTVGRNITLILTLTLDRVQFWRDNLLEWHNEFQSGASLLDKVVAV